MNLTEREILCLFLNQVREMREAQQKWEKTKKQPAAIAMREAEAKVDKALKVLAGSGYSPLKWKQGALPIDF